MFWNQSVSVIATCMKGTANRKMAQIALKWWVKMTSNGETNRIVVDGTKVFNYTVT